MKSKKPAPINQKFNKLTILEEVDSLIKIYNNKRCIQRFIRCKCDCGNIITTRLLMVINNKAKSCGCLTRSNDKRNLDTKTHGLSKHRLYNVYHLMIQRCYDESSKAYKNYGGRGIKVCLEWKTDFIHFYKWAIENGYKEGLKIDRIENNKGYNPNNCRFTNEREQARNRRTNVVFTINGRNYLQVDLAKMFKVSPKTIQYHRGLGKTGGQIFDHFNKKQ